MKNLTTLTKALVAISLMIILVFWAMYLLVNNEPNKITFIIPDQMRGVFKILEDENNGLDGRVSSRKYIFEIPDSGILVVRDLSPLENWHQVFVKYKSGLEIISEFQDDLPSDEILFWGLTISSEGEYFGLIGTHADFLNASKKSSGKAAFLDDPLRHLEKP